MLMLIAFTTELLLHLSQRFSFFSDVLHAHHIVHMHGITTSFSVQAPNGKT